MNNINDNITNDENEQKNDDTNIQKTKKRIKNKELLFQNERQNVLDNIIGIVGTHFYSHNIDANQEKQLKILALDDDIKKYFSVSNWSAYKPNFSVNKRPLSIVRSVLKDMGIKYKSRPDVIRTEGKQTTTTEYVIEYNK